jgi:hypothetical protein
VEEEPVIIPSSTKKKVLMKLFANTAQEGFYPNGSKQRSSEFINSDTDNNDVRKSRVILDVNNVRSSHIEPYRPLKRGTCIKLIIIYDSR